MLQEKHTYFCRMIAYVAHWLRLVFLVLCVGFSGMLYAESWYNTQYNTTEGSEFYITTMKNGGSAGADQDIKVYIYATSRKDTYLKLITSNWDTIMQIPAGKQNGLPIPVEYIYSDMSDPLIDNVASIDRVLQVTKPQDKSLQVFTCDASGTLDTTQKVSLYITNYYYKNGYEATNVLPIDALEREYMVQTYFEDQNATEFAIVATEPGQTFDIKARVNDKWYNTSFTCEKNQTRLIRTSSNDCSLAGTIICSSANFVVVNGNQFAQVGGGQYSHVFEQSPSADKWGNEYVVTRTHGHEKDEVLLTAIEDSTIIFENNTVVAHLMRGDTYYHELTKDAVHFVGSKKFLCYLYEEGDSYIEKRGQGSPAMTTITPISMGVNSIIVAEFNATADDLQMQSPANNNYFQIQDHYINIVTESRYKNSIQIGDELIGGFKPVPGTNYWHTIHKIDSTNVSRVLWCTNPNGTFTARMYGYRHYEYTEGYRPKEGFISYAYSAGMRVNHAVDVLINDEYIKYKRVCLNKGVKFTPIINYEYDKDHTRWIIGDSTIMFSELEENNGLNGVVDNFHFPTTGLHEVLLEVHSFIPLCGNVLVDTVRVQIEVDDLSYLSKTIDPCYGEDFEIRYKGDTITLKADTTIQYLDGMPFNFTVGTMQKFVDTIPADTTNGKEECDLVLTQNVTIRPIYNKTIDTIACDVCYWTHTMDNGKIDTVHVFRVDPEDKLPVIKEHTIRFGTREYDCDSIVTKRVTLNKSYNIEEDSITCQDWSGKKYEWKDHDTIDIPLDKVGEFTYVDHLTTKEAPYCDSIHTLHLKVTPRYDTTEVVTICQNDTFFWNVNQQRYVGNKFADIKSTDVVLNELNKTITFVENFETVTYGCDSIHRLEIKVYPVYDTLVVDSVCFDDLPYIWEGKDTHDSTYRREFTVHDGVTLPVVLYDTVTNLKTIHGCDSIVRLQLEVNPVRYFDTTVVISDQESYSWIKNGQDTTVYGDKCPVAVDGLVGREDAYVFEDHQLTHKGCDSTLVYRIHVYPTYDEHAYDSICQYSVYTWEKHEGSQLYDSLGNEVDVISTDVIGDYIYVDRLHTIHNYDSIWTLHLHVNPSYPIVESIDTFNICDNESFAFYNSVFNGHGEWRTGDYLISTHRLDTVVPSVYGCDSAVTHVVHVHPTYYYEKTDTTCQNSDYAWYINKYLPGGSIDTARTYVSDDITNSSTQATIPASFIPTDVVGSFTYVQRLHTKEGCDSVLTLHLYVNAITEIVDTIYLCDNSSVEWHNNLYVGDKYNGELEIGSHENLVKDLPAGSVYYDTIVSTNELGCNQYYYLTLNVTPTYDTLIITSVCEDELPYIWKSTDASGKEYSVEFNISDSIILPVVLYDTVSLPTIHGCDSIVRLQLEVNPVRYFDTTVVISDQESYSWIKNGQDTTVYGDKCPVAVDGLVGREDAYVFEDHQLTHKGCDSTLVYRIHVYPTYDEHAYDSICQYSVYTWEKHEGSQLYDSLGNEVDVISTDVIGDYIYVDRLHTIHNYDSIWTLHLHVNPSYPIVESIDTFNICDNESFAFYNSVFNGHGEWRTGDYLISTHRLDTVVPSVYGCDSAVTHVVHVHPTYYYEKTDTTCQNSDYAWYINKYLPGGSIDTARTYVSDDITNSSTQATIPASFIPTDVVGSFTYVQRLHTKEGCDSVLTLHLYVNAITEIVDTIYLCDNSSVEWHNNLYVGDKYNGELEIGSHENLVKDLPAGSVYYDTIVSTNELGCNKYYYLTLNVNPTYETTDTVFICGNDASPYKWYPKDVNGTHVVEVPFTPDSTINEANKQPIVVSDSSIMLESQLGCDSLVHLHLIVQPSYLFVDYDTICQLAGGTYEWRQNEREIYSENLQQRVSKIALDNDGEFVYVDSLKTDACEHCPAVGCDSVYQLHLKVLPTYTLIDTVVKISDEETFAWHENGLVYGGASTREAYDVLVPTCYPDTFVTHITYSTEPVGTYTCDSVRLLKIVVGQVMRDTTVDETCCNLEYAWMAKDRNGNDSIRMLISNPETKIYTDVYTTILGFDSIFYLDLTVHPAYVGVASMTMYQSTCQHSDYKWIRENNNGYPITLYNPDTKKWIDANEIPTDIPGHYTYIDSLTTEFGCDSVWTLHLRVDSTYLFNDTISMCDDQYVIWENKLYLGSLCADTILPTYDTLIHVQPQWDYRDTISMVTHSGCDSVRTLSLNIHALYDVVDKQNICDDVNPFLWITNDTYGTYIDTVYFTPSELYVDSVTGEVRKDSINITDRQRMLTSVYGCDSLVHLELVVHPTYFFLTDTAICSNQNIEYRGKIFNQDTVYNDTVFTDFGCDMIYQLRLHVKPSFLKEFHLHICDNEIAYHESPNGNEILWEPGDRIPGKSDCFSVGYLTKEGCDSMFRYFIEVHPTYDSIVNQTICSNDSCLVHDNLLFTPSIEYYEPGSAPAVIDTLITDTLKTVTCADCKKHGCDSIFRAYIRILPAYRHIDSVTICSNETYHWRDRDIRDISPGQYNYVDSLLTVNTQCDSIYKLVLTVLQSYDTEIYDSICANEYYYFGDKKLNQTGIYIDSLHARNNCDSIVHLYLTVLDTTIVEIYDTICVSEKYHFFDRVYTEPGVYDTITLNEWGCKQYNYLYLDVIDTTRYNISIGDVYCADDEEIWIEYEWLSGRRLIEYSVFFDDYGHSQGFEDIIHAPLDTTVSYLSIPVPRGEDIPMPNPPYFDSQQGANSYVNETKQKYPEPNVYTFRLVMHNGICGDSLQQKDTTVSFFYPSWIHEQHWNDGIVLYNQAYNGGFEFSSFQWYQNGDTLHGATKEYLYIPSQLLLNEQGDCENYYQVELIRASDGYKTMTCPICPVYLSQDTIVPLLDYIAIVPTAVSRENPVVHVLSTLPGTGVGAYLSGQKPIEFQFEPDKNNYGCPITLPISYDESMYVIRLTTKDGNSREFKIMFY